MGSTASERWPCGTAGSLGGARKLGCSTRKKCSRRNPLGLSLLRVRSLKTILTAPFTSEHAQMLTFLKTHLKQPGDVLPEVCELG